MLGGGSNVVLPDEGVDGTVLRVAVHGLAAVGATATACCSPPRPARSGSPSSALCVADRLVGVEALSGIPGLVGASVVQNIGAYGQDVSQTVVGVRAYDRTRRRGRRADRRGLPVLLPAQRVQGRARPLGGARGDLRLGTGELSAPVGYAELARRLGVEVGERAPLSDVREAVLALRRGKGMVLDAADPDTRSAGSFFTNPLLTGEQAQALRERVTVRCGAAVQPPEWAEPDGRTKVSAAWLIERSGFGKGAFDGPVGISHQAHPRAGQPRRRHRTPTCSASPAPIRDGVREAFGVELVPEPVLVGRRALVADPGGRASDGSAPDADVLAEHPPGQRAGADERAVLAEPDRARRGSRR